MLQQTIWLECQIKLTRYIQDTYKITTIYIQDPPFNMNGHLVYIAQYLAIWSHIHDYLVPLKRQLLTLVLLFQQLWQLLQWQCRGLQGLQQESQANHTVEAHQTLWVIHGDRMFKWYFLQLMNLRRYIPSLILWKQQQSLRPLVINKPAHTLADTHMLENIHYVEWLTLTQTFDDSIHLSSSGK